MGSGAPTANMISRGTQTDGKHHVKINSIISSTLKAGLKKHAQSPKK